MIEPVPALVPLITRARALGGRITSVVRDGEASHASGRAFDVYWPDHDMSGVYAGGVKGTPPWLLVESLIRGAPVGTIAVFESSLGDGPHPPGHVHVAVGQTDFTATFTRPMIGWFIADCNVIVLGELDRASRQATFIKRGPKWVRKY